MQLSNEALAKDMEALGLVPDSAAIAVALKGSVFDLPLVIAREAVRFNVRVCLAWLDQADRLAIAAHAGWPADAGPTPGEEPEAPAAAPRPQKSAATAPKLVA
jgi:hypothetical protein